MIKKREKYKVFNTSVDSGHLTFPSYTQKEEREIIADLFEQIMLFDRIILKTGRVNYALFFLIKNLGLTTVEELIEKEYIKFLLYTPIFGIGVGRKQKDGTIDESTVLGTPPIISGTYQVEKDFVEKNINNALSYFELKPKQKRNLIKKIRKNYIIPKGMEFASNSSKFIVDAYESNLLAEVGLPFEKDSNQLLVPERKLLQKLGGNILETTLLSEYSLKSFNNYENFEIYKSSLESIGSALKVTENAASLFKLEEIPNLKQLFLTENLSFKEALELRHTNNAQYFRKWLNTTSENANASSITKEYLNEIKGKKGKNSFFDSAKGKLLRTVTSFVSGVGLETLIPFSSLGVGLLDTFVAENLIKGKNPSLFIEDLGNKIKT